MSPPQTASSDRTPAVLAMILFAMLISASTADAQDSRAAPAPAAPEVVQKRDIERALGAPRTRGLRIAPRSEVEVPDPASVPAAVALPAVSSVALDIPFEKNSSALRPSAAAQLEQLAGALRSEALDPFRFLIAGHTDASGDAVYNRRLSARRADVVRRRLIDAGVPAERLDARGFGEDELLDPAHPGAPANRRVEIRNLGAPQP